MEKKLNFARDNNDKPAVYIKDKYPNTIVYSQEYIVARLLKFNEKYFHGTLCTSHHRRSRNEREGVCDNSPISYNGIFNH